jgi:hypothetical protein
VGQTPVGITGRDSARAVVKNCHVVLVIVFPHRVVAQRVVLVAHITSVTAVPVQRVAIAAALTTVAGDANGYVLPTVVLSVPKGDTMDSKRIKTRPLTVKSVQKVMEPYSEDHLHTLQQVLSFFGIAPKLERILWATLKKEHERRRKYAEEMTYGGTYREEDPTHRLIKEEAKEREYQAAANKAKLPHTPEDPRKPRDAPVVGPPKLTQVVDVCECGGNMVGTVIPTCDKVKYQPIFYKECVKCTRYVETYRRIRRKRMTYTRSEGG